MSRVSASSLPRLVLASTSQHRRQLLERFGIRFTVAAPDVDESPLPGETPVDLVARLARAKAEAVAHRHRSSVVIGSDQVAVFGRQIIGKPGNPERAIEQLRTFSGQSVTFHTAVHLVHSDTGSNEGHLDVTTVHFRKLSQEELGQTLRRETSRLGGAQVSVFTSGFGGAFKSIQIQMKGDDARVLTRLAQQAAAEVAKVPGAVDVGLSTRGQKPELEVELNRGLAGSR